MRVSRRGWKGGRQEGEMMDGTKEQGGGGGDEETLRVKASRRPGETGKSGGAVRSHAPYRISHAGRHVKVNVL